jgi:hypothetical protein
MFNIGVTGTQKGMSDLQLICYCQCLAKLITLYGVDELRLHHGRCIGADEQMFFIAKMTGIWTIAHPPIQQDRMSKFESDENRAAADFLVRNHNIVDECDILIVAPFENHEILRSGTWATYRYAKKIGTNFIILDR